MDNETDTQQRFAEEKDKIKVESYQKVASLGGWAGGSRTLWAISTIGTIAGAAVGLVAPFFPLLVGASSLAIAAAAIPVSVAAFATVGMAMGFTGGLVLGRISGSASAVAEEQEKRMKEWTARQLLQQNSNAKIIADPPKEPEAPKSNRQRLKDTYRTHVNPRVGLVMAGIGLAGGLIMAAAFIMTGGATGPIMPALGTLTGLGAEAFTPAAVAAAPAALIAYSGGVMAAFGALWTFNFPRITSEVTHMFGKLIDGTYLGRKWEPEEQPAQAKPAGAPQPAKETEPSQTADKEQGSRAAKVTLRHYESYKELVAQQAAEQPGEQLGKR